MKPLVLILITIFIFSCKESETNHSNTELEGKLSADLVNNPASLESNSSNQFPKITFTDTLHDFGRMKEGEIIEYEFTFVNDGQKDLIITEAKGSCGCTVPTFPNEPIKAGQKSAIKVTFNSEGKKGYNEKVVVVLSNANPTVSNLTIRAEVQ